MNVKISPMLTGAIFFRASSKGSTLQMAATGIKPQGTIVPPPMNMAVICPNEASMGTEPLTAEPNVWAREPVRGSPEKPAPSNPVTAPIAICMNAVTYLFKGVLCASQIAQSFNIPD